MKRIVSVILCAILLTTACVSLVACNNKNQGTENSTTESQTTPNAPEQDQNAIDYVEALRLLEEGKYEESKELFEKLGDYKDSAEYLSKFYYLPAMIYNDIIGKGGSYEYFFNENNLMSKYVVHRDGTDGYCEFFYYENGNIKQQAASINGVKHTFDYTFNANGQRETAVYKIEGEIIYVQTFTYDEHGRQVVYHVIDIEGNLLQQITYSYDDKGNIIKHEYVFDEAEYNYILNIEYIYNDEGTLVKEIYHYNNGSQESLDYTYDVNKNIIKKVLTYSDGAQDVYDYTYDEHGNMVKEVLTNSEGVVQYVEYEYVLLYIPTGLTNATRIFFAEMFEEIL